MVVGLLEEDPGAVEHLAGVDLAVAEAVGQRGAVVAELHHLTHEVRPLVDAYAVGAGDLEHGGGEKRGRRRRRKMKRRRRRKSMRGTRIKSTSHVVPCLAKETYEWVMETPEERQ